MFLKPQTKLKTTAQQKGLSRKFSSCSSPKSDTAPVKSWEDALINKDEILSFLRELQSEGKLIFIDGPC